MDNKEFAKYCNIKTNRLSVEISRGKVVCEPDGSIDPDNEKNVAFRVRVLGKQANKQPQIPRSETFQEHGDEEQDESEDEAGILPLHVSEKRKVHFAAIKIEKEIAKLDIDIAKKTGEVVPSEPIIPIFLQHNQHILMEQKNADEEMLTAFAHKYSIDPADVAHIRGEWVKRRNAAITKATEASKKSVASIINDYSDKRGIGERN